MKLAVLIIGAFYLLVASAWIVLMICADAREERERRQRAARHIFIVR